MPLVNGEIWADSDGQFIVDEEGQVITLIPDVTTEPSGVWTEEAAITYEVWDTDE